MISYVNRFSVNILPMLAERCEHSHSRDGLGIPSHRLRDGLSLAGRGLRLLNNPVGASLIQECDEDQYSSATDAEQTEGRVKRERDEQIEGHPWQVENSQGARSSEKPSHLVQIMQGLCAFL
jgi:hypothetical protein